MRKFAFSFAALCLVSFSQAQAATKITCQYPQDKTSGLTLTVESANSAIAEYFVSGKSVGRYRVSFKTAYIETMPATTEFMFQLDYGNNTLEVDFQEGSSQGPGYLTKGLPGHAVELACTLNTPNN